MMIISQGAEFDIATISGTAQSVILQFKDASGANLDIATYSFRGALRGPGAVALCVTAGADNKTAVMAWSKLNAGKYAYDVFLVAQDGTERQILRGVITAAKRVTPSNTDDVITIADIIITIPDNPDGTITITDRTSSAADRAESAAQAAVAAASEVGGHVVDAAMHVSEAEREAWNNKADLAGVERFLEGSDHVFRGKNEFKAKVTFDDGIYATQGGAAISHLAVYSSFKAACPAEVDLDLKVGGGMEVMSGVRAHGNVLADGLLRGRYFGFSDGNGDVTVTSATAETWVDSVSDITRSRVKWDVDEFVVTEGKLKSKGLEVTSGSVSVRDLTASSTVTARAVTVEGMLMVASGGGRFGCSGPAVFQGGVTMTNLEVYSNIIGRATVEAGAVKGGNVFVESAVVLGGSTDGDWLMRSGTNKVILGGVNVRTRVFLPSDGRWGDSVAEAEVLTRGEVEALIDKKIEAALGSNS